MELPKFEPPLVGAAVLALAIGTIASCFDSDSAHEPSVSKSTEQPALTDKQASEASGNATIVGVDSQGNTFVVDTETTPHNSDKPELSAPTTTSIAELAITTDNANDASDIDSLANTAIEEATATQSQQEVTEQALAVVVESTSANEAPLESSDNTVVANGTDTAVISFIAKGETSKSAAADADAEAGKSTDQAADENTSPAIKPDNAATKPVATADQPPVSRSWMPVYDATTMNLVCDAILQKMDDGFEQLEKLPMKDVTVESVLHQWNSLSAEFENIEGPVYLQAYVSPNAQARAAGEACIVRLGEFNTSLFQRSDLYQRVKATKPEEKFDVTMRQDLLDAFDDNGIGLSAKKQSRIKELKKQISELSQTFSRNVRENDSKLTFSGNELAGLPDNYLERVGVENDSITVGFDYPEVFPFLNNAENEDARQRYLTAFSQRGTPKNLELLDQIMQLRKELAGIFDQPSYAHLITRRRMVGDPKTVWEFLDKVESQVQQVEINDLKQLAAMKAKLSGSDPDNTEVKQWDKSFLKEQTRKQQFAIDQEALRQYFPMPGVVDWGLWVASELYGISFKQVQVPVWHEDVLYYDVSDSETGEFLGGIYLDLYPRDGKYKHAAAFGVRGGSLLANRRPNSVLVTNFDRKGLTHDELETFLHELGHVFHGVLTQTKYLAHAGTSVKRDFVEAPSQMFEEWARSPQTLKRIPDFCENCPSLDNETIERLNAARNFGRGIDYSRQHLYASFDMRLAGENPEPSLATWYEMEGATPIGALPDGQFPGAFGHIAGGYAAGYYGYMWSEVLAIDMLSAFGDNLMDKAVGKRFRETILEQGGQREPMELVTEFLGRKPSPEAFFKEITGQRK